MGVSDAAARRSGSPVRCGARRRERVERCDWLSILFVLALAGGAAPAARASSLTVTPSAAWVGTFGLEVHLGCEMSDLLELGPAPLLEGYHEACGIDATEVTVGPGGLELVAGMRVSLGEGFSVPSGVTLELGLDPSLGVEFTSTRTESPNAESRYAARFYLRLDDLAMGPGSRIEHLNGYDAAGRPLFRLVVRHDATLGRRVLDLVAHHDDGGEAIVSPLPLASGWNEIGIDWRSGPGDGHFLVSVNGAFPFGLTGLSNPISRLDEIRWGAVDGALAGVSGWLQVDDFSSWR